MNWIWAYTVGGIVALYVSVVVLWLSVQAWRRAKRSRLECEEIEAVIADADARAPLSVQRQLRKDGGA